MSAAGGLAQHGVGRGDRPRLAPEMFYLPKPIIPREEARAAMAKGCDRTGFSNPKGGMRPNSIAAGDADAWYLPGFKFIPAVDLRRRIMDFQHIDHHAIQVCGDGGLLDRRLLTRICLQVI